MSLRRSAPALVAAALLASYGAHALVTAQHPSTTLEAGVRAPAVVFEAGPGAGKSRYVSEFAVSPNLTSFSGVLRGQAGADVKVKDLVRIHNEGGTSRVVTFRASAVSNDNVQAFTWTVRDGALAVTVFDYKAASPTATFTLPAGATYSLELRVRLAEGAGNHNAAAPFGLRTEVA